MRYTKEIFDILNKGGFISQNSISQQRSHLYDAIEDDFQNYQEYFSGIGFLLRHAGKVRQPPGRDRGGSAPVHLRRDQPEGKRQAVEPGCL